MAADGVARDVEVAREGLADLLGVATLAERGEAHEVGEQDRDEAALGDGCSRARGGAGGGPSILGATDVPHLPQNRWSGATAAPHDWQATARRAPHAPQNRLSARIAVAHSVQVIGCRA